MSTSSPAATKASVAASKPSATASPSAPAAATKKTQLLDPHETAIVRRLPPALPRRKCDIYITNKTDFRAQLQRCQRLLDDGEPILFVHSLGAAIPRAINLALRLQKDLGHQKISLETATNTVELTDDFEPVRGDAASESKHRYNSAVHIKITQTVTKLNTDQNA